MKYQEQKDRMVRLYKKINPESGYHGDQLEYEDNLWYFFLCAWHLKDWIKSDMSVCPFDVETIVHSYHSLRLCADIANRTKHVEINNTREDGRHTGNDVTVFMDASILTCEEALAGKIPISKSLGNKYNYWITDRTGARYSAIELSEQILKDWDEIISNNVRLK